MCILQEERSIRDSSPSLKVRHSLARGKLKIFYWAAEDVPATSMTNP